MVARSELTAAMAAAKAQKEEAQAKAELVEGLEAQLARLREQLRDAQASLSESVPRAELSAALARLGEATAKLVAADQAAALVRDKADKHQEALAALKEALELKEAEAADLRGRIQVRTTAEQGGIRGGVGCERACRWERSVSIMRACVRHAVPGRFLTCALRWVRAMCRGWLRRRTCCKRGMF